jgi:putative redox protein
MTGIFRNFAKNLGPMKIRLRRVDDAFNMEATDESGHSILMDGSPEIGAHGRGVRPMQVLIMGMGGCAAIDIIQILNKQRQQVREFYIEIEAERQKDLTPSLWEKAHIIFTFAGSVDPEKARKAADLSMNKYCSVAATLSKAGTRLSWEVIVKN